MNSEKDSAEIWKRIIWNGIPLFVSNKGNIKDKRGKIKNQNQSGKYNRIWVAGKNESVHRIIAVAFVPNPNHFDTVNHIDENKRNNIASNLEWCTREQNVHKRYKLEHPTRVSQYDLDGNKLCSYNTQSEASRKTGIARESINRCCLGKRKTAGGFMWQFDE